MGRGGVLALKLKFQFHSARDFVIVSARKNDHDGHGETNTHNERFSAVNCCASCSSGVYWSCERDDGQRARKRNKTKRSDYKSIAFRLLFE